jgi:hypothetical protein
MPLPATEDLFGDETPLSGAIRHAGLMGYPSSSWIGDLCGRRFPALLGDREALERLADWVGEDREEMVRRGHLTSSSPENANFWGEPILSKFISPGVVRLCPLCIREQPYLRSIWSLDLCRVCHIHECALIDSWPGCGKPIGFDRADFEACTCEKCQSVEEPTKKRYSAAATLWRRAHGLLHSDPTCAKAPSILPADFNHLCLAEFLKVLALFQTLFAKAVNGRTLETALRGLADMRRAEFCEAQEAAAQFILRWPHSMRAYLEQELRRPSHEARIADHTETQLAPVLPWDLEPALKFVEAEILTGISVRWQGLLQSFRGNAFVPGEDESYMASGDAETLLGMKPVEVRRCFDTHALTPGSLSGSTRPRLYVVHREAVMETLDDLVRNEANAFDSLEENTSFSRACAAAHVLQVTERALLGALRRGEIAYGFVYGARKCVGTIRISYDSLVGHLQRATATAAPEWISFSQATDLSLLKPKTLESVCAHHSIEVRGDKRYPDTREVHLASLLEFKRHRNKVARLSSGS